MDITLKELYFNFILKEEKCNIKGDYMKQHTEINFKMREILVKWLIDVWGIYNFINCTLFHCIKIIDLYLLNKFFEREKLRLLGIVSLLISCKLNESYIPKINDLRELTNNAYIKNL